MMPLGLPALGFYTCSMLLPCSFPQTTQMSCWALLLIPELKLIFRRAAEPRDALKKRTPRGLLMPVSCCLPSDARGLAASRAGGFTSDKGHSHSFADCVGWSECQETRLGSSLIAVCTLAFCSQGSSVICSTPWASALTANPPWQSLRELQMQNSAWSPRSLITSHFFHGCRERSWVSPHNSLAFFKHRMSSLAGVSLCCGWVNLHIMTPKFH